MKINELEKQIMKDTRIFIDLIRDRIINANVSNEEENIIFLSSITSLIYGSCETKEDLIKINISITQALFDVWNERNPDNQINFIQIKNFRG